MSNIITRAGLHLSKAVGEELRIHVFLVLGKPSLIELFNNPSSVGVDPPHH